MSDRFIGEPLRAQEASADTSAMGAGEPGLPCAFLWRGRTLRVSALLRRWRDTGPCRHGSGERYVRKHWFEVRMADGAIMRPYFDRQSRGRGHARWWLFSIRDGTDDVLP